MKLIPAALASALAATLALSATLAQAEPTLTLSPSQQAQERRAAERSGFSSAPARGGAPHAAERGPGHANHQGPAPEPGMARSGSEQPGPGAPDRGHGDHQGPPPPQAAGPHGPEDGPGARPKPRGRDGADSRREDHEHRSGTGRGPEPRAADGRRGERPAEGRGNPSGERHRSGGREGDQNSPDLRGTNSRQHAAPAAVH